MRCACCYLHRCMHLSAIAIDRFIFSGRSIYQFDFVCPPSVWIVTVENTMFVRCNSGACYKVNKARYWPPTCIDTKYTHEVCCVLVAGDVCDGKKIHRPRMCPKHNIVLPPIQHRHRKRATKQPTRLTCRHKSSRRMTPHPRQIISRHQRGI